MPRYGPSAEGPAWSDVAATRNGQRVDQYRGNPAWATPTKDTSPWSKRPQAGDAEAAQRHYDEYELDRPAYTSTSIFGGERKVDSRGREVNNPGKKRWWQGLF